MLYINNIFYGINYIIFFGIILKYINYGNTLFF